MNPVTRLSPLIRDLVLHSHGAERVERGRRAIVLAERLDELIATMLRQIDFLFHEVSTRDKRIASLEQKVSMLEANDKDGVAVR